MRSAIISGLCLGVVVNLVLWFFVHADRERKMLLYQECLKYEPQYRCAAMWKDF
jgi:hypothetical protein